MTEKVYVWDENVPSGDTQTEANWVVKPDTWSTPQTRPLTSTLFIGYTVASDGDDKVYNQTDTALSVTYMGSPNPAAVYLGKNVTFRVNDCIFNNSMRLDFGDLAGSTTVVTGKPWRGNVTLTLAGEYTMESQDFSYTLISPTGGNFDASATNSIVSYAGAFTITDQNGSILQFAATDSDYVGQAGYYWFEATGVKDSYQLQLVAKGTTVPEPATATLSLLALAGLCARRRRK